MQSVTKEELASVVASSYTLTDVLRSLGLCIGGSSRKKVKKLIELYNLNTRHFDPYHNHKGEPVESRECPICGTLFKPQRQSDTKVCCSYSCANTHFRSGKNNPNFKGGTQYRRVIGSGSQCADCGESRPYLLMVHHVDGDRKNNDLHNLEIVCPTHHAMRHLRYDKKSRTWVFNTNYLTPREMLCKL